MRTLQLRSREGPDALELVELGEPERQAGTVLIDVHAPGASFPDLLLTRSEYQIRVETPFVPGIEGAGILRQSGFAPGDRVSAVTAMGGGFADVALAPAQLTFPTPHRPWEEIVALTINCQTAWLALTRRGRVGTESRVATGKLVIDVRA
jgi:NADPH2:quinone reductase